METPSKNFRPELIGAEDGIARTEINMHLFITPRIWQPEAMGLYAIIFDAVYASSTLSSLLCTLGLT